MLTFIYHMNEKSQICSCPFSSFGIIIVTYIYIYILTPFYSSDCTYFKSKISLQYQLVSKRHVTSFSFFSFIFVKLVTFNPWKVSWNWIVFSQNCFAISPGFLYHLIRRYTGRPGNEAFTSNRIVSSKQ